MASARPQAAQGAGVSSSCASPSTLAEEFRNSDCKSPIQCFQRFHGDIIEVVREPSELWDQLVSLQFFSKGENERSEATHLEQAASHKEKTEVEKVRTILGQVREKTDKLPKDARYDSNAPLVIFIVALAQCKNDGYVRMAKKLRDAITTSHDCAEHSTACDTATATGAANEKMSADEIEELCKDGERVDELVLSTMRNLKDEADGVDVKQITRGMERIAAGAGCNSALKKSVNRSLDQRLTKRSLVKKNDKKHGNLACYELT